MEIMGLVVIVILITLGLFFVVKFIITKQPSEIKKSYTRTETAANILNTLLKTTAEDCYGMTVKDLLVDCAKSDNIETNQVKCENTDQDYSCEYVLDITKTIFDETLVEWGNQPFDLKAYIGNDLDVLHCINGACIHYPDPPGGKCINCTDEGCTLYAEGECVDLKASCTGEREAKQSYIPTDIGIMTINLEVC